MNNLLTILRDFYSISQKTKIKKKKLRIAYSALAGNVVVILDILIILLFTKFLTNNLTYSNFIIEYLADNKIFLPVIVILRFAINFIGKYNVLSLQYDVEADLRNYLMKEMYEKGNYSLADATYFINTLSIHMSTFYGSATIFLTNIIQILIFLIFLVDANAQLVGFMFIGVLFLFFPTKYLLKMGRVLMDESFHINIQTGRDIQRIIDNTYLIKILKTSSREFKNFENIISNNYIVAKKAFKYKEVASTLPQFISVLGFSIIILFTRISKSLTIEFIGVILRLVQTIGTINNSLAMLVNSHVHVEKFLSLDNNYIENKDWIKEINTQEKDLLKIEDVNFKYYGSDQYIFKNLNLKISKGKHYTITGENGSGKSTLIGLLSGILTPESGKLYRNNEKMGYIGANPLIVTGTLRENLTYGSNKEISDSLLEDMLNNLKVFKESSNKKLDEQITSSSLSSGQMQKISFIRCFSSGVEILFLDESTSNLDDESKKLIKKLLNDSNLTIINSTHNKDEFNYDECINIKVENNIRELSKQ